MKDAPGENAFHGKNGLENVPLLKFSVSNKTANYLDSHMTYKLACLWLENREGFKQ